MKMLLALLLVLALASPSLAATCVTKSLPQANHATTFATITLPPETSMPIFYVAPANGASLVFWTSYFSSAEPAGSVGMGMYHFVPNAAGTGNAMGGTHDLLIAGGVTNTIRDTFNNFALSTPMQPGEIWAVNASNTSGAAARVVLAVLVRECTP